MTEPLKIGIVGLGKMGGIRAKTIRDHDDTVLVSGTDSNPPAKGFKDMDILPDYQSVINSGVDAVFGQSGNVCRVYLKCGGRS